MLALVLVVMGMAYSTPTIPGWDDLWRTVSGVETLKVRAFKTEYFYPLCFFVMMLMVALSHSMWREWRGQRRVWLGAFMDIALVLASAAISLTYLIEIDSVCLIDQVTGERALIIAEALKAEIAVAEMLGLPVPDTVDDPKCRATTGVWLVLIMGASILVFLGYNIKVWGLPLVSVAILVALYTIGTVLVWYFHGPDDINKYFMTKLGGEPRTFYDGIPNVHDALVNNSAGLLGRFMAVIMSTVFPYIILGALFGKSAGGQTLIKLAFRWTRNLRGGPAHAAIISSAMFRHYLWRAGRECVVYRCAYYPDDDQARFFQGVCRWCRSGGFLGRFYHASGDGYRCVYSCGDDRRAYRDVIVAAAIPALAYFFCLFLSAAFQSRKQGIEAIGEFTEDMYLSRADVVNLLQVVLPMLLILVLLLTPKDNVGCSFFAQLLGADASIQNGRCVVNSMPWLVQAFQNAAGDAGATGWWATVLVMVLLFLDKEVRAKPKKLVDALAHAGVTLSSLYLMLLAVSVIDVCLNFTGLSKFIAIDVLRFLLALDLGGSGSVVFQIVALTITMLLAIVLGMGMPPVPAYINCALLMGPMLVGLGIASFTANMFIFYYAIAAAITPPVALAAFAASTITKAEPMATGFSAVRSGVVMFFIPFVFAFYPELLLVDQALIDPTSPTNAPLPGYEDGVLLGPLLWLIARLVIALYLLASALAAYDSRPLSIFWIFARLVIAVALLVRPETIHITALVVAIAILLWHHLRTGAVVVGSKNPASG